MSKNWRGWDILPYSWPKGDEPKEENMKEGNISEELEKRGLPKKVSYVTFVEPERLPGPHKCCAVWKRAMEDGSDSEGWKSEITWHEHDGYSLGSDALPQRIKFCPWCGVEVNNA